MNDERHNASVPTSRTPAERPDTRDRPSLAEKTGRGSSSLKILYPFRWPLAMVLLGAMALLAYIWTVETTRDVLESTRDRVADAGRQLGEAAGKFMTGDITERFLASLPEIASTGSGNLELATVTVTEAFSRADEKRILWDLLSLGETFTEIKVPVTYRYHVRLDDEWQIRVRDQLCIVQAPPLRPSLPPAIHTDQLQKRAESGWLRFNVAEQMVQLEQSMTGTLNRYAADPRHLQLVREECRKTIARFVRLWLFQEDHWRDDRVRWIVVLFPEERQEPHEVWHPTIWLREAPEVSRREEGRPE
ncbi:MAG: hypothetical protein JXQ27_15135 [Acidobacteria bacterium]|nr:hypothetical protein [Acidobacteriota bacterium]